MSYGGSQERRDPAQALKWGSLAKFINIFKKWVAPQTPGSTALSDERDAQRKEWLTLEWGEGSTRGMTLEVEPGR